MFRYTLTKALSFSGDWQITARIVSIRDIPPKNLFVSARLKSGLHLQSLDLQSLDEEVEVWATL